jgi:hypothetical protein
MHATLTSFQEGPHAFHYAPEFIFALKDVLDMPVKLIRASGFNRSGFDV